MDGTTRRRFLGTAAGATGVAIGAAVWGAGTAAAAVVNENGARPLQADKRGYTAGKFALLIGTTPTGWVQSVEDGHATADVVNEKLGPDHIVHKHLAGVKYEDITVNVGAGMSKAIYDWVAASWKMNYQRKNGAIHAANFDGSAVAERQFYNALITETTIPAADGSSKEPCFLTIKFAPEFTRVTKASGKLAIDSTKQKQWLPSNFRLQIDGLDCSRVSKVESFTVKQKIIENAVGEQRDYQREPASVEFPNLVVTVAQSHAESWYKWHEDFVIKGSNGQENEKSGSLTFLTPDLQGQLFVITFHGLGIFKASDDILDTDDETGKVTFSLYCETMDFAFVGGPREAPTPTPTNAP